MKELTLAEFENPGKAAATLERLFKTHSIRTRHNGLEFISVRFPTWSSGPATIPASLAQYFCYASALGPFCEVSVSFVEQQDHGPMIHVVISDSRGACVTDNRPGYCTGNIPEALELIQAYFFGASARAHWGNSLNDGTSAERASC